MADHLTRVKDLANDTSPVRVIYPEDREALRWLLDSHARLLAAAKAWRQHLISTFPPYPPGTSPMEKTIDAIAFAEPKP